MTAPRRFTKEEREQAARFLDRLAGDWEGECEGALRQSAAMLRVIAPTCKTCPHFGTNINWRKEPIGICRRNGDSYGWPADGCGSCSFHPDAAHRQPVPSTPIATPTEPTPRKYRVYTQQEIQEFLDANRHTEKPTEPTPPPAVSVKRCGDGPCQHFQQGEFTYCINPKSISGAVPADGSGFCHLHSEVTK